MPSGNRSTSSLRRIKAHGGVRLRRKIRTGQLLSYESLEDRRVLAVSLDMVPVGNAGNAADSTGYGDVVYPYQNGKYEVTIGQYAASTAPGQPTGVAGTPGNSRVSLSWTAPASNGGSAITDYVVEYKTQAASTWTTFSRSASTATTATVTGLTNGTAYVFRVSAKNAARTGVPSAASSSVTPRPETGPPEVEVFVNSMPFAIGSSTTFLTGRNILSAGNVSVSVTLVNSGRGDLVISDWNLNQDFIATSPFPDRISPNGSVTVSILPSASPFGRRSGALTFKTNDSDEPSFNITLRGMVFESVSSAPGEAIRVPDGVVTLYESDPRFTVSIEPANGPMDFDGAYVIRRFDSQGRLVSRQTYNGLMSEVVIYGSVNVENWTSFTTRPIRVRFR